MNEQERILYIQAALAHEVGKYSEILFPSEEYWEQRVLPNVKVDPLNVHKPHGLLLPQLVKGVWVTAFCPPVLLKPVQTQTDDAMSDWLTYWMLHLGFHQIVLERVTRSGLVLPSLGEIETLVDTEFETRGSTLYHYGKTVATTQ